MFSSCQKSLFTYTRDTRRRAPPPRKVSLFLVLVACRLPATILQGRLNYLQVSPESSAQPCRSVHCSPHDRTPLAFGSPSSSFRVVTRAPAMYTEDFGKYQAARPAWFSARAPQSPCVCPTATLQRHRGGHSPSSGPRTTRGVPTGQRPQGLQEAWRCEMQARSQAGAGLTIPQSGELWLAGMSLASRELTGRTDRLLPGTLRRA